MLHLLFPMEQQHPAWAGQVCLWSLFRTPVSVSALHSDLAPSLGHVTRAAKNQGLFHGLCYVWLPHTLPCSGSLWPAVFSSCTLASLLGLIPFLPGK